MLGCTVEILKSSVETALIVSLLIARDRGTEASHSATDRTTINYEIRVTYSTNESSAMLYLLIILNTGLS